MTERSERLIAAIDTFVAHPQRLADVSARAQGASTGPWTVHVATRVGSFLLDNQQDHAYDLTVDYPLLRGATYRIRDEIEDDLGQTWPAVKAAQEWLEGGPASLAQALSTLDKAEPASAAAASIAAAAIAREGEHELSAAAAALRAARASQDSYVAAVAALHDDVAKEHSDRITDLRQAVTDQLGAPDDAMTQLSTIRSLVATTQTVLTACVHRLVLETAAASESTEALACATRETARDLEWISVSVEQGLDPASLRGRFAFDSTLSIWHSVADHLLAIRDPKRLRSPLRPASLRARASARRY